MKLAEVSTVTSKHRSKVLVNTGTISVALGTVLFIPKLQPNLLPRSKHDEKSITTVISKTVYILKYRNEATTALKEFSKVVDTDFTPST